MLSEVASFISHNLKEAKLTSLRTNMARKGALRACILGALAVAGALQAVRAQSTADDPSQRDWKYTDHADVKTGELYPAAFLMSQTVIPFANKAAGVGHGYIGVNKHPQRPLQVTVSWDPPYGKADPMQCKVTGCQLRIRFGTSAPIAFTAVQSREFPYVLALQETGAFLAAAQRHVGTIEVEFQTAANGPVVYQVRTASPFQVEKIERRTR